MKKKGEAYRVGEMADYFGVSRDTLRIYDRRGILSPQKDEENNYRMYNREDFIALDYAMRLRRINLPLDDIKMLLNDCSIEKAEAMMQVQSKLLDEKLEEIKSLQVMVSDYQKSFSNMIQNLGRIWVETSPRLLIKMVDDASMIDVMGTFNEFARDRVPKFTFVVPKERFLREEAWMNFSKSETRRAFFDYAITLVDDENFVNRPGFPQDQIQVMEPCKCVHGMLRTYTGKDYSDFMRCRDYILDNGLQLISDPMFRNFAVQYNNLAYYEFWAPVE